jgi:DNA sulfur modification protein DndB
MPDYVPAIKGKMGDWVYYVTAMKLGKVAKEVSLAADVHTAADLDDLIQREIGDRVQKEMVPYLLTQPQHFYGALIVAVYGGDPEFNPVKVAEHQLINDDEKHSYGFGLLRFDGSQKFFALDGQHRLRSIQLAVEMKPELRKEEVTVIIVKHDTTPDGLARTRRLFSTINRRAQATKQGLNIAIDEDDSVAIITRWLVRRHPYLGKLDLVKANKEGLAQKQLPPRSPKNAPFLTTLHALYECNGELLPSFKGGIDIDKSSRPSAELLDEYYDYVASIWTQVFDACPDLQKIASKQLKPGSLRNADGEGPNSAIARPLGQMILSEVISAALRQKQPQQEFIQKLFKEVSMDMAHVPWAKVIWNPDGNEILSGGARRELVVQLILDKFGLKTSKSRKELLQAYRDFTQDKKVKLLRERKVDEPTDDE